MPRIAASNIEEHIRLQTERIIDAASTLFGEKGYRGTDIGDIAKSVGLARNSLYRYYASKDHILVAVMKRDMAPIAGRIAELEERFTDPAERIDAWLELQIELATGPCHAMIKMLGDVGDASDELRAEIHTLHEPPNAVLETTIAELLEGTDRDAKLIGAMIVGMVQGAAALAMQKGNAAQVTSEMKQSVRKIFTQ